MSWFSWFILIVIGLTAGALLLIGALYAVAEYQERKAKEALRRKSGA